MSDSMKRIFISSVQKEFERERAAIKRMIESDPILKPHFKTFVFEIDAPASDKTTQQVYLKEIEKSDIYLLLVGNKYGYCKEGEVSPTEQEFDKAQELGLTKLVFVRGTDNSKRDAREALFLDKVSRERVRVRYQDSDLFGSHRDHQPRTPPSCDQRRGSLQETRIACSQSKNSPSYVSG